jgi:serine/threonine protein kinase
MRDVPKEEFVQIATEILMGLHVLHSRGIVHRAIKFKNVLCEDFHDTIMNMVGDVDFLGEHRTEGRLPTYMAPELIKGESSFSYASDVWALGILFYRLLTHEFPFK